MRITVTVIFLLICLDLSQAQTPLDNTQIKKLVDSVQAQVPPNTNPTPAPYPELPRPAPAPTPSASPTPTPAPVPGMTAAGSAPPLDKNSMLNPVTATSGKYEEYQSICRSHEYDNLRFQPADMREAKIAELKQQAENSTEGIHDQLPLLKEYLTLGDMKNFTALSTVLKNKKSDAKDNDVLNALLAMSNRNYRSASSILLKTLANDEKNEEILKLLAEIYAADGNYYEASTIYEDLNKEHKGAYLAEQCEALVSNSLNADGEKICLEAARRFPDNPFPFVFVGITHRERENLSTAISFFKKSLKIRSTEMASTCLAEGLFIQKKFSESAEAFGQSLAVSPSSARAIMGLAWARLKAKDFTASLAAFQRACAMNNRYQSEIRKAFKFLQEEKITEAKKFLQLAESCGG